MMYLTQENMEIQDGLFVVVTEAVEPIRALGARGCYEFASLFNDIHERNVHSWHCCRWLFENRSEVRSFITKFNIRLTELLHVNNSVFKISVKKYAYTEPLRGTIEELIERFNALKRDNPKGSQFRFLDVDDDDDLEVNWLELESDEDLARRIEREVREIATRKERKDKPKNADKIKELKEQIKKLESDES